MLEFAAESETQCEIFQTGLEYIPCLVYTVHHINILAKMGEKICLMQCTFYLYGNSVAITKIQKGC